VGLHNFDNSLLRSKIESGTIPELVVMTRFRVELRRGKARGRDTLRR